MSADVVTVVDVSGGPTLRADRETVCLDEREGGTADRNLEQATW